MNCVGDSDNTISFSVSNDTTRNDLTFGPGSYPIGGGLFSSGEPAGTFNALLSVEEASIIWGVDSGTFEITRWDNSRIEGRFEFTAHETFVDTEPREAEVVGTFNFSCKTSSSCD